MDRLRGTFLLILCWIASAAIVDGQTATQSASPAETPAPAAQSSTVEPHAVGPAIAANAPHISKQTRLEIIRDFETQLVYSRTAFPMGNKGLTLKDGVTSPNGQDLQQLLALWGPAIRPGDPAHISYVQIKNDHIHFDINGGAIRRKKWYQRIEVTGTAGAEVPLAPDETQDNPHGSYLDIYFDKYVPEMTAQQLRSLLYPVLDFSAHNKEEAYLDTLPPKVKQAIQAHYVLVGMNSEMVLHAKGKPPKKDREKDGDVQYEEWIYGEPPQDVDFVRFVGDEVVRVETMKVDGEKIVRTQKEVILDQPDKATEAKKEQEDRQPDAPSLRRPGEDQGNVPKAPDGMSPSAAPPPPDVPRPPDSSGPNQVVPGRGGS
ncbi:MAG TPA: hypothetical protein VMG31_07660 [Verrucomicrobiae bacterium]|nr:hypothetical protein [Verrucomicrobiae bacterium]